MPQTSIFHNVPFREWRVPSHENFVVMAQGES